jgi:hypothetical protein
MALKENQKLWFLGATVVAISGITVFALKKISNFVEQFSFTPTVKQIQIVGAKLLNFPPILGNAQITVDIRIDNPLNSSHAITDFSVRIFDTTTGSTQIGNSLPISQKITIPASSSAVIGNVQVLIPVSSLFSQLSIPTIQNMVATQQLRLNKTYTMKVHLKLDGIVGNTETNITI